MSNALTPSNGVVGGSVPPAPFANPFQQIGGVMGQPAVRRALPMILLVGLVAAALLAWSTFSTPTQKVLFTQLTDGDKAAVTQALSQANIDANIDDSGSVTVAEEDFHKARMLLAQQDLPKALPGGYQILDQLPMGVSRAVEGERLRQARETELARSIQEIDAVAEARVHLAMPEKTVFVRENDAPSASVIVKLNMGRTLGDAQVRSIVNLVASSVPGMKPENVTIVDQAGGLLSKPDGNGATAAGDARIEFQSRLEDKVRTQLTQLLTPLIGAGNFSTEVQAEVDLNEASATRETYDKDGSMLRAEQGQWTGNQKEIVPAGGIPGTLSNTAPPGGVAVKPGASPAPGASPSPTTDMKQSDQFARAYDLGKEVSVSRTAPGELKRLSVAVLLREPEKGRRTALEVTQITDLVKAAVGFNATRQDQVTIISKKFAATGPGGIDAASTGPAWYDNAWLPMIARNVTAIVIALLVLILGVKPLASALMKRSEAPAGAAAGVDERAPFVAQSQIAAQSAAQLDRLETANNYDDRVGAVRGFTRDNPARAALAVRDMIKADAR